MNISVRSTLVLITLFVILITNARAENPVLYDFDGTINFASQPDGTDQFHTWIPTEFNNGTEIGTTTTEGSQALKYIDEDGSRENGVYAIYPDAIPETGNYILRCKFKIWETKHTVQDIYEPYWAFSICGILNGSHRSNTGKLAAPDFFGYIPNSHLTPNGNDSHKPYITIETQAFDAVEGDDLIVIISSAKNYVNYHKLHHPGSYVIIDEIQLYNTVPVSLSSWTLE